MRSVRVLPQSEKRWEGLVERRDEMRKLSRADRPKLIAYRAVSLDRVASLEESVYGGSVISTLRSPMLAPWTLRYKRERFMRQYMPIWFRALNIHFRCLVPKGAARTLQPCR